MARPLSDLHDDTVEDTSKARDSGLSRATARAFAAAVSALLIATLVVNRSSDALTTDGTGTGSSLNSGTISLIDDDQGRSLFDLSSMAPGRPVEHCIEVVYDGTILPVDLALLAESGGALSAYLDVAIEEGMGGSFESCDGFVATDTVFDGTLAQLSDRGWQDLGRMVNSGDRRSFRIHFDLQDSQEALGQSATADFVWEVTPS